MAKILILIDDDGDRPFWMAPGWVPPSAYDDVIPVSGFATVQGALSKVYNAVADRTGSTVTDCHVVTDSNFGIDPAGGSELLWRLRQDGSHVAGRWTRAVIYSENPKIPHDFGSDCHTVRKGASLYKFQYEGIFRFLKTGHTHNLESLLDLEQELRLLAFACDLSHRRGGSLSEGGATLAERKSYGEAMSQDAPADLAADVFQVAASLDLLFSPESSEYFGSAVESEFYEGLSAHRRGGKSGVDEAWRSVKACLDPMISLEVCAAGGGANLRLLWEIVHTGGAADLLRVHPYKSTDWLKVFNRAALRGTFDAIGRRMSQFSTRREFARLCNEVVLEIETVQHHLECARAGARILSPLKGSQAVPEFVFEDARAHLSHVVLRNGLLNRLASPPDLWSDPRRSVEDRAADLADNWPESMAKRQNVVFARRAWLEPWPPFPRAAVLLRRLIDQASHLPELAPTALFPAVATVEGWIADIDAVTNQLGVPGQVWSPDDVKRFWKSAIGLSDFLAGVQVGGDRFSEYFA